MTPTPIRPVSRSAYGDLSEALREQVDRLVARVAAGANWKVRKKTLLDILIALESTAAMPVEQREELFRRLDEAQGDDGAAEPDPAESGPAEADPESGSDTRPETLVLFYAGAILERLGETAISGPEQAAMYSLSIHPEHGESVLDWMKADLYNARALKKVMRGDRRFRALQRHLDAAVDAMSGDGSPAGG